MGLKLAADFDVELFFGRLEKTLKDRDEALRAYLSKPRANFRTIFDARPAPTTSRLVLDLGAPAGGLVWSVQQVVLTAVDPFTSAAAGSATVTSVDASATAAAAAMAPSLPAVAGATNAVTGFEVTGTGATAGSTIQVTLTGVPGGPLTYDLTIPAGAGVAITPLIVEFMTPIQATGPNVAITLNVPSFGAGNLNAAAVIHGTLTTPGAGAVTGALFVGAIPGGLGTGNPPDMNALVAAGLTPPVNYQAGGKSVVARANQHVYAVLSGGLSGFTQYFATGTVLEVPDTMEALAWL